MPLPQWEDRRMLFSKGREVHEPAARRNSDSSMTDMITKTVSNASSKVAEVASPNDAKMPFQKPASPASPTTSTANQRRRSSAASSSGMFSNLTGMKRGSQDYHDRRSSIEEMSGKSGMFGGLWGSTVRGVQNKPNAGAAETKRGVME